MRLGKWILRFLETLVIFVMANIYSMCKVSNTYINIWLIILMFISINVIPSIYNKKLIIDKRLRICGNGCELLILFVLSTVITVTYSLMGYMGKLPMKFVGDDIKLWIINTIIAIIVEALIFWNGIIRVYVTSKQLGLKYRVIGIICGWIPIAHLVALGIIISIVSKEVKFENNKMIINQIRKDDQICNTKYPILMVHGVFFRDFKYMNYWGRIPEELSKNGAKIFYGNQQSAASVAECGAELADRIRQVLKETGADKVNIIAHSKGGLDSRYAIALEGAAPYVASLTTINTPHRGCEFADYLLNKIGKKQQDIVAGTYNAALRRLGDENPDFLSAVYDLTSTSCGKLNEKVKDSENIYYQSVGSKLNVARGGRFPLNFSYHLVNYFDGANDGLVGESSFGWGSDYQFLTVKGKRGISHGDMIDLNRENIDGFDVREFYVQLVAELKNKGL